MRKLAIGVTVATLIGLAAPAVATAPEKMDIKAGEASGFVPVHGAKTGNPHKQNSPNLLFHGGAVMTSAAVQAIYWGTRWSDSSFVNDKVGGLDTWYAGFGNSKYAAASNEYSGTNGQVTSNVTYGGHLLDTSAAPNGPPSVSTILAEVAKKIVNPVSNGYYPVYIDQPRGGAGYCAWHSYGTINGTPVQIAFFFNLDGDPGCDPGDTTTGHSQGLAALANVSAHELSEARTDPRNGGWWDANGDENGDKCAWAFPSQALVTIGGQQWLTQGEWSNKAYSDGTGLANLSGQNGCIFSAAR
jgi:hypothetical protein